MEQALYDRPEVYDALYASKDYESEVDFAIDRFDAHGNDGERALLVGCGTGRHSVFLRERGFEVTGVDPNPAMLDRARERSDGTFLSGGLPGLEYWTSVTSRAWTVRRSKSRRRPTATAPGSTSTATVGVTGPG
ncbi:hypothetical protein BRC77_12615 [Halobacteriales archaeon QH_8_64_26]|nr:MAG: hypothetical protein BRC77_12615 [Halobacteriales archaeon QH_8_64_26]